MGWRHARADAANFDRGLTTTGGEGEGDAVLDLSALRNLSPYGLVAMACLAAHNDRLLAQTKVVPPAHPAATAELVAAGFGFVVREFLCPVAGPPLPLPPPATHAGAASRAAEPLASGSLSSGSLAYGPLAASAPGRRAPVVHPPAVSLRPVHDGFEEGAVADDAKTSLTGSVTPERLELVVLALRILGENRRLHAGSFDAYVAAAVVDDGGTVPRVELAVGDCGMGLRASLSAGAGGPLGTGASGASPSGTGTNGLGPPPAGDAGAIDRVLVEGRGLADLAERVTVHGGTVVVRTGDARHTVCTSGTVRARVPWMRGTIVAVSFPTGVPKVPSRPAVHQGGAPSRPRMVGAAPAATAPGMAEAPLVGLAPAGPAVPVCPPAPR